MKPLRFNRDKVSQLTWESIYDHATLCAYTEMAGLMHNSHALEKLRDQASYDTGSISAAAIWTIFSTCLYFEPKIAVEVGTFIGKSTLAMAHAMDQSRHEAPKIFTCDFSNNIELNLKTRTHITQFPNQSSTEMFRSLAQRGVRCDVLMLDGRLQKDDSLHLSPLLHEKTVIMLDDFEGIEKGCVNAMGLMQSLSTTHLLVYPPTKEARERRGLHDSCTLGLIVPKSLAEFTNQ